MVNAIHEPVQFQAGNLPVELPEHINAEEYNMEQTTMVYPVTDGKLGDPVTPEDVLFPLWLVGMGVAFLIITACNLHLHI